MSRPLILDPGTQRKIAAVRTYAEGHPYTFAQMHRRLSNPELIPGHIKEHCCIIPLDYLCCYSIEEQKKGMHRHLSVSVKDEGKLPHPAAFAMVMEQFGFTGKLADTTMWREDLPEGRYAINAIEPL